MGISEHNTENLSGFRSFGYPVLFTDKSPAEYTFGTVENRRNYHYFTTEPEHLSR